MAAVPAPRTARDFARIELTRTILTSARRQLSDIGPGELSLRAVARDVGLASSAVYRYFPSRDHLITALLIECYDELGAAVELAESGVARTDLPGRFAAATTALREWALANFHEYALLFGSPVPGYAAPEDTIGPALRVPVVLLSLIAEADAAGLPLPEVSVPQAERLAIAATRSALGLPLSDERLALALMAWATLIGALTLELFGHLKGGIGDFGAHFAFVTGQLADQCGLGS